MKSRILGVFVLIFSLAAFAGKVPQAELNIVNDFIASQMGDLSQMVEVKVASATRSKKTKQLSSANIEANIMGVAKVELGLKTKKKNIILSGSLAGSPADIGMEADDLLEIVGEAQKFVEAINKKGDYKAKFEMNGSEKGTKLKLEMVPTKENKKPSIKKLELKGFIPADSTANAKFSVSGNMNGGADNVKTVRTAVTNIFNSLASEELPSESDFEALGQVIEQMFKALEDIDSEL